MEGHLRRAFFASFALAATFGSIHYLMQTVLGAQPYVFASTAAQILLALCILFSPRRADLLMRDPRFLVAAIAAFVFGSAALLRLPPSSPALWTAAALVGGVVQLLLVYTGVVLVDFTENDRRIASFCGMGGSFFIAVIAFSLPAGLSFAFQTSLLSSAAFVIIKLLRSGGQDRTDSRFSGQARRLPWKHIALCAVFSLGFHYVREGEIPPSDLAIAFALPAALSLFLVAAEIRFFKSQLFPFTEFVIGACLAVPLLYYGAGFTSSDALLAIKSFSLLGYFLVTPCYYLLLLGFVDEERQSPHRMFAAMYLVNSIGELLNGILTSAENAFGSAIVSFSIAVTLALAAFFCALVPMSESVKSTIVRMLDAKPSDSTRCHRNDLIVERLEASCQKLASQHGLTKRESEVLVLLARRWTLRLVSESLCLSINTVKTHVRHIYTKMGIHSQQELIDIVEAAADEDGSDA